MKGVLNGTEHCDIPHNTLELNCDTGEVHIDWMVEMMSKNLHHNPAEKLAEAGITNLLPIFDDLELIQEGRGVRIRLPQEKLNKVKNIASDIYPLPKHNDENIKMDPSDYNPILNLTTRRAYSVLGRGLKISDINSDNKMDLIASAPGLRGCVFVVLDYMGKLSHTSTNYIEDVASLEICSESEYARFGSSFVVTDVNGDGVEDIVIGEPYTGAEDLQYHGGVIVYLGDVSNDQYSLTPSTKFTCTESPCGLGSVLYEDAGYLFMGAPNAGVGGRQRGTVLRIRKRDLQER